MPRSAPFRWQKLVVLPILLWALLDLSVPGLCSDEYLLPSTQTSQDLSAGERVNSQVISALASPDSTPSTSNTIEEDCWCCCSHIVPARPANLVTLATLNLEAPPAPENPSQGWSLPLYHPPRA
jgi:hypothetical protein